MENLTKLFIFKNLKNKKKKLYIILLIVKQQKIKQTSLLSRSIKGGLT